MEPFFDQYGRDMVIMDWLSKNKPELVKLYRYVLGRRVEWKELNDMILLAFETGIEFSHMKNARQARTQ